MLGNSRAHHGLMLCLAHLHVSGAWMGGMPLGLLKANAFSAPPLTHPGRSLHSRPLSSQRPHGRRGSRLVCSAAGGERATLVYDPQHEAHNLRGHPEKPERATAAWEALKETGLMDQCRIIDPREATDEELLGVHTKEHIHTVTDGSAMMDSSTYFNPAASSQVARVAAGSVAAMTEEVMTGKARNGFCVVRPPGHHAVRHSAMGFCIYNNVAVAAQKARRELGAERVLVFDWDVHHGNGVQDIFYEDPNVLYISVHRGGIDESYFFPGSGTLDRHGKGKGKGFTVNIPCENVMGYTGDALYEEVMRWIVSPVAKAFNPDLILVSAGYDAADGDPLGGFSLSPGCFARMTKAMMNAAPDGRLVLALEGGYNVEVTADCVCACTRVLLGEEPPAHVLAGPHEEATALDMSNLKKIADVHREWWPSIPLERPPPP